MLPLLEDQLFNHSPQAGQVSSNVPQWQGRSTLATIYRLKLSQSTRRRQSRWPASCRAIASLGRQSFCRHHQSNVHSYTISRSNVAQSSFVQRSIWLPAGVNYNLDNALPQGTIYLDGVSILFENSYFANLLEYGDGSITFQDSTVAFQNATFVNHTQSTAGAIFANNTVLSIDNSVFTNNYGFQSGAIQLLGSNSAMYINRTTFLNNIGMHCCQLKHLNLSVPCLAST